ncbi:MAG: hypothetical protein OXL40_05330 [Bacteroidota bacterium]|nr:hypothetical protein [Bacteroidota bacterium]
MNTELVTAIATATLVIIGIGTIVYKIAKWSGSVNSDRSSFKEFMREIKEEIKNINNKFDKINEKFNDVFRRLPPSVAKEDSPLKLTEFGREISKLALAYDWAVKTADKLENEVKGKKPYQVQKFAFKVAENNEYFSDKEYERIQEAAYERGIDEKLVRTVLGIELRDKLLEMTAE